MSLAMSQVLNKDQWRTRSFLIAKDLVKRGGSDQLIAFLSELLMNDTDISCDLFMDWCDKNGVISDKITFPYYFEGVRGIRATKQINHREMVLAVPYKLII